MPADASAEAFVIQNTGVGTGSAETYLAAHADSSGEESVDVLILTEEAKKTTPPDEGGEGSSAVWGYGFLAVLLAVVGGGVIVFRRRNKSKKKRTKALQKNKVRGVTPRSTEK